MQNETTEAFRLVSATAEASNFFADQPALLAGLAASSPATRPRPHSVVLPSAAAVLSLPSAARAELGGLSTGSSFRQVAGDAQIGDAAVRENALLRRKLDEMEQVSDV